MLRDGRIAYLLKVPRRGRTHRIMTPLELMARLSALIAPPRIPMVRYHGVFASIDGQGRGKVAFHEVRSSLMGRSLLAA